MPDRDVEDVARWRQMTPEKKMALVSRLWLDADARLTAELRAKHPAASEREVFLRKAINRLGYALAIEAFPDAAGLDA